MASSLTFLNSAIFREEFRVSMKKHLIVQGEETGELEPQTHDNAHGYAPSVLIHFSLFTNEIARLLLSLSTTACLLIRRL